MKRHAALLVLVAVFLSFLFIPAESIAQTNTIVIPAGTPEDHDLQAISNEQDAAKKLAMYQDFVQKYSSNPAAVAYGDWQLAQAYQTAGDLNKALEYGDKALVGSPRNLDILVSQASIAQQAKDNGKLMDYAARGGEICHSIDTQSKPEGLTDDAFKQQLADEKSAAKNSCTFLESAAFNVIASEDNAKTRMAAIEKFSVGVSGLGVSGSGFKLRHVYAGSGTVERSGAAVCVWRENAGDESQLAARIAAAGGFLR